MSNLVDDLKTEHAIITAHLNRVKAFGISSEEGQNTLLATRSGLIQHLKKEDDQLYSVLNRMAENDVLLRQTLDMFADDMKRVTETSMEFFDKYSGGGSGLQFARDFGRMYATLSYRIFREENILYKKFESLAL